MPKTVVYLKKSNRPDKKFMVFVDGKTVHFGAAGMSDFTKHKDKARMKRYTDRHKRGGETWTKSGLKTAGFWSKWLLWNKPTIGGSKKDIASRFNVTFKSGWPSKGSSGKSKRKARKSKRKARKSKRKARKSKRKARKSKRKARKSKRKARKSKRKARSRFSVRRKVGKKYERCVLAVKSKQPKKCMKGGKWVGGKGCVNPFAVCTSKVGRYN
jgi:hypothetical protein